MQMSCVGDFGPNISNAIRDTMPDWQQRWILEKRFLKTFTPDEELPPLADNGNADAYGDPQANADDDSGPAPNDAGGGGPPVGGGPQETEPSLAMEHAGDATKKPAAKKRWNPTRDGTGGDADTRHDCGEDQDPPNDVDPPSDPENE